MCISAASAPDPPPPAAPLSPRPLLESALVHRLRASALFHFDRCRRHNVQAHLVDQYERLQYEWHPLCQADFVALAAHGIDLRDAGLAYGTQYVEIKFNRAIDHLFWDQAMREATAADSVFKNSARVVAIDPGVRTFLMVYLLHPNCQIRIGHGAAARIDNKFNKRHRALTSERAALVAHALAEQQRAIAASAVYQPDRHLKQRLQALSDEMKDVTHEQRRYVDGLHQVAVRLLTTLGTIILCPNYRTSVFRRTWRRLSAAITRHQGHLRFHDFRLALESRCATMGRLLGFFDESFSTALCSDCGHWNKAVGASKVVTCPACGLVECRDGGGAGCILKKAVWCLVHPDYAVAHTANLDAAKGLVLQPIMYGIEFVL